MSIPSAAAAVAERRCEWKEDCSDAVLMVLVLVSSSDGIWITVEGGSWVGYLVKFVFVFLVSIASDVLDLSGNSIPVAATKVDWDGSEDGFPTSVVDIVATLETSDELGFLLESLLLGVIVVGLELWLG